MVMMILYAGDSEEGWCDFLFSLLYPHVVFYSKNGKCPGDILLTYSFIPSSPGDAVMYNVSLLMYVAES